MNFSGFYHETKSRYAYAVGLHTLHLRLRTGRDTAKTVKVITFDPFVWSKNPKGVYKVANPVTYEMHKEHTTRDFDWWFAQVEVPTKRAKYGFIVENGADSYLYGSYGEIALSKEGSSPHITPEVEFDISPMSHFCFSYPYILEEDLFHPPTWVRDTVWYQIFPERYKNSGDPSLKKGKLLPWGGEGVVKNSHLYGGDVPGITASLDEIKEMGFTGIYLTPIFTSPSTHKYNTEDYLSIDPAFGTDQHLGELVAEAHKRGIKIMLDLVFNHIGSTHPIWKDVVKKGKDSPYYNWFCHREDGSYETFATVKAMPKWNTADPKARAYLIDIARYWAKKYPIDGYRLDVANEVSHDFWRVFRKEVKAVNPEIYILGEVWDDAMPWLQGDQFDGAMNYPLAAAIWGFVSGHTDGAALKDSISSCLAMYPRDRQSTMLNLIGTHDTSRILTECNGRVERVMQAFTLLMTMPGSPMCLYGDEIGLAGAGMDDARKCMLWDDVKRNLKLRDFVKELISLRANNEDMRGHEIEWLKADSEGAIYRKGRVLVALNGSNVEMKVPGQNKLLLGPYGHCICLE